MNDLIRKALSAKRESKYVDFKSTLDLAEPHSWCEIIKDIIAMANSGGGVILIGLDNAGHPSGCDPGAILDLDPALLSDKIRKYTGVDFDEFEIVEERKGDNRIAVLLVGSVSVPVVFTKPGTYQVSEKKQKTAFANGTVYFRHGAKSEPGTTQNIRKVIERQLDSIRRSWVKGMRRVVQAPHGHQIVALGPGCEVVEARSPDAIPVRFTDDPSAPAYRRVDPDHTHPYRQTELVHEVNRELHGKITINAYDIQVIKQIFGVVDNAEFTYRPKFGSTQYSRAFADWIVQQYEDRSDFFANARAEAYKRKRTRTKRPSPAPSPLAMDGTGGRGANS